METVRAIESSKPSYNGISFQRLEIIVYILLALLRYFTLSFQWLRRILGNLWVHRMFYPFGSNEYRLCNLSENHFALSVAKHHCMNIDEFVYKTFPFLYFFFSNKFRFSIPNLRIFIEVHRYCVLKIFSVDFEFEFMSLFFIGIFT